ncbi:MAG TPA: sugar transferase [Candidatus Paceibacterota bacterium]|nr:sugar transferase [Candidatus Paceibacterota bacterium]
MTFGSRYRTTLLFLGDVVIFFSSLWLTLLVRYATVPDETLFNTHIEAFAPLFFLWLLVFYMSGLYGKRIILFKTALFGAILRTQLANIVLAALYFFFVPGIGIAPKTNLFLYLLISLGLVLAWRLYIFPGISHPLSRERAALVGAGPEVEDLVREVNGNTRYSISFPLVVTPAEVTSDIDGFAAKLKQEDISLLVVDMEDDALRPLLPKIYELAFIQSRYPLADFYDMYEEVFDRVPLSLLQYEWFLKNVSLSSSFVYPVMKRATDIVGGLLMGLVTLVALPFVALALRFEGKGPIFIQQTRFGKNCTRIKCYKFRTMRFVDGGMWPGEGENKVTKVGAILRQTSLDEFPQFVNVLKGELSLIGPRNDLEALGERLGEAIPYYQVRYVVTPGITGWAQINQQYEQGNISPQSIEETKTRLAYDFYYIKNRSLALDVVIALKTVKRMLFRVSSW